MRVGSLNQPLEPKPVHFLCRVLTSTCASVALVIAAAGCASVVDRLERVDTSIKAEQFIHAMETNMYRLATEDSQMWLAEYEKQKAGDPDEYTIAGSKIPRRNITNDVESIRSEIEWSETRLRDEDVRHGDRMMELTLKRDGILKDGGFAPGTCEIHGIGMVATQVEFSYGYPGPMPGGYNAARLTKFRNSATPLEGGCLVTSRSPNSLQRLVCPACEIARMSWLKENSTNSVKSLSVTAASQGK